LNESEIGAENVKRFGFLFSTNDLRQKGVSWIFAFPFQQG